MKFLVDANVLSEMTRPSPNGAVLDCLKLHASEIAVDPVILGEIRYGILLLPKGKKRTALENWFALGAEKLQCLSWDREAGLRCAELLAGEEARNVNASERQYDRSDCSRSRTHHRHPQHVGFRKGKGSDAQPI